MSDGPDSGEAKVCERHGLALTPEGRCVMCGLDSIVVEPPTRAPSAVLIGLAVCAVFALGVAGAAWIGGDDAPEPDAELAPSDAVQPRAFAAPADRPRRRAVRRSVNVADIPRPGDRPLAAAAPTEAPTPRTPSATKAPPDKYALAAARRRVNVKMYATGWCAVCRKARTYMNRQGISFTELDIEKSASAGRRHLELNPEGSVPTFDIDGQVLIGFNARRIESAIDRAAQSHL